MLILFTIIIIILTFISGLELSMNRTLFLFSQDNFLRKYAKMIIEWGYPLLLSRKHN